jgi:hypothetical protein
MSSTIYTKQNKLSNKKVFNKMVFIINALEKGWKIKKAHNDTNKYVFYKKCRNESDARNDLLLETFVNDCLIVDTLFS